MPTPSRAGKWFAVDADVLIRAHHDDYPPDIFPGVWEALARACDQGVIVTTPRVFEEVSFPPELAAWMKERRETLVADVSDPAVVESLRGVMVWADGQARFPEEKRREFERSADPELIAYALANRLAVMTNEQPAPRSSTVKIPDVCDAFDIEVASLLDLFRHLGAAFVAGSERPAKLFNR